MNVRAELIGENGIRLIVGSHSVEADDATPETLDIACKVLLEQLAGVTEAEMAIAMANAVLAGVRD